MFDVVDSIGRRCKQTVRSNGDTVFMSEFNDTALISEREPHIGLDKVDLKLKRIASLNEKLAYKPWSIKKEDFNYLIKDG